MFLATCVAGCCCYDRCYWHYSCRPSMWIFTTFHNSSGNNKSSPASHRSLCIKLRCSVSTWSKLMLQRKVLPFKVIQLMPSFPENKPLDMHSSLLPFTLLYFLCLPSFPLLSPLLHCIYISVLSNLGGDGSLFPFPCVYVYCTVCCGKTATKAAATMAKTNK